MKMFAFVLGLLLAAPVMAGDVQPLLDAIHQVESSGAVTLPPHDDAGSIARGPLQIHEAFFLDSGVAGKWEDCDDFGFSCRVAVGYWQRYCPKALQAGDFETLARVFNGGPRGDRHIATLPYWHKVQQQLQN